MKDRIALIGAVALAAGLAVAAILTPRPLPADAPTGAFSAGRALQDIAVIAAEPHPTGSAANQKVRDQLIARMSTLGLGPQRRRWPSKPARRWMVSPPEVENLVGVLPGRDRTAPAVTVMAHYDSAPGSPGAGDDATGVAAALETVRAIRIMGTPARDLMLVFTDGEEPGLLGAQAFFAHDPLAQRIGVIVNLEARGGGGRAAMFETGRKNGGLVRILAGASHRPMANSAAVFVYRLMPNSTDFTPALAPGKTGYNFAFLGRQFDYHAPTATVANLDKGSVQSMGDELLPLVRALAFAPALPAPAPELVFSQLFGPLVLAYPPAAGWLAVAAAAALLLVAGLRARPTLGGVLIGVLAGLGILAVAGLLLWVSRGATGVGFGFVGQRPLLARFGLWEAAMVLAAAVPVLLLVRLTRRWPEAGWLGLLLTGLLAAAALQLKAPLTAYLVAWPVLAGAVMAAVSGLGGDRRPAILALLAGLAGAAVGWIAVYFHMIALALDLPPALAVFAWLAALVLWPLLRPLPGRTWLAALLVMAALVGVPRFTDPWSERHPNWGRPSASKGATAP